MITTPSSTIRWTYDGKLGKPAMTGTSADGTMYRIEGSGAESTSTMTPPGANTPVVLQERVAALLEHAARQEAQPEKSAPLPTAGQRLATQASVSASDQASAWA
jgi:hypothetical protein